MAPSTRSTTDMTFPHLIESTNDLSDADAAASWVRQNAKALKAALAIDGAILFRGFPITSAEDFDRFSAAFDYGEFTYEESLSNAVRINRTRRVFTANEAPPEVEIFLHHEMAQTPVYPQKIFFCCLSAAEEGGATPICRSDDLFDALKKSHPEWANQFSTLGVKYSTHMPGDDDIRSGQGRSWKSTLSVSSRDEAEARLTELGYSWQWFDDGSLLTTTPALAAVRELPDGRHSFFNQVIAAYRGWKRRDEAGKPVLTFGNGETIPDELLEALVDLSRDFIVPIAWQDGDIALVDNYRVMHGRFPYAGNRRREVLVCLARESSGE